MMKFIIISLCSLFISATHAAPPVKKVPEKFDAYVEGAMVVYSQFKTPSKKESEEFYSFLTTKWMCTECVDNCTTRGIKAGAEYAEKKKIEIKPKK